MSDEETKEPKRYPRAKQDMPSNITSSVGKSDTFKETGPQELAESVGKSDNQAHSEAKVSENPTVKGPQPPSAPIDPAPADREVTPDIPADPLSPSHIRSHFSRLLDKVQLLALQKVEQAIKLLESKDASISQLTEIIVKLADLKLTTEWTKKLEAAILKNPTLMQQGKGGPLLQRLQGLAGRTKRAQGGDGRESHNKFKRATGTGPSLPQDD